MKLTTKVSIQIVLIFSVAIVCSTLGEYFSDLLGDYNCNGVTINPTTHEPEMFWHFGNTHFDNERHWGTAHWWLFSMSLALMLTQIAGIIDTIDKDVKEKTK
jgi:hypothetical protein